MDRNIIINICQRLSVNVKFDHNVLILDDGWVTITPSVIHEKRESIGRIIERDIEGYIVEVTVEGRKTLFDEYIDVDVVKIYESVYLSRALRSALTIIAENRINLVIEENVIGGKLI